MRLKDTGAIASAIAFAKYRFSRRFLSRLSRPLLCAAMLVMIFACAVPFSAINSSAAQNENADEMDSSVKPGDDFYRYANGGWLKTVKVSPGQPSYDNRATLNERTNKLVRDLIQGAATTHPPTGTTGQKVGDYYASFMD